MWSLCHWHRGVISYFPGARQDGAVVNPPGERFGGRAVSASSCSGFSPPASRRFQLRRRARFGCRTPRRRRQRSREEYSSLGKIVCQSAMAPYFASRQTSSEFSQAFSPFPLLPLTAIAVAFSRAASLMATWSGDVESRVRVVGIRNEKDCPLVEEFVEAANGSRPWRPGLEKALMQQGNITLALLSATGIAHDHLTPIIAALRANPTFMSGLIAWTIAQAAKVFTYYLVVRKWDFRMVMGSGGMPSSHSALCFALTTSVAFTHGVSDALFPVCLGFTLIVMYDAAGVRRHAGRQAEVLNMIVADLFQGHPISDRKLKELLGHTPLQVFAGAALGIVVGYFCSQPRLT